MSKYLVTGVNGFVGSYFVDCLKGKENDCHILGVGRSDETSVKDIEYNKVDMTSKEDVFKLISDYKPDYIVNLAAQSSVAKSWLEPYESFMNNIAIFLNILESDRLLELKSRILLIGTSEEYGIYDIPIQEIFSLHPKSPYSVSKLTQEYLAKLYCDKYKSNIVMTRSFNHIGPKQSDKFVISSFVRQLVEISKGLKQNEMKIGNIDVVRDFCDVRDIVEAYYLILKQASTRTVYNVCSGFSITLREIINIVAKKLNVVPNIIMDKTRIRVNDIPIVKGDNTKLKTELGWEPKYTLDETLNDIINYWNEQL